MAPLADRVAALMGKRALCPSGYYYSNGYCYSAWSWYGRWILVAVIIVVVLAIFFLWACVNSRRRRRQGMRPMYGTGWMAPNGPQNYNNPNMYGPPPPAYGAPGQAYPMNNQPTGTTFATNDGYYGQREGVQAPKNVYNNNPNTDYAPPDMPPPGKASR